MADGTALASPPLMGSTAGGTPWSKQLKPWLTALSAANLQIDLPALATASDMAKLGLQVWAPSGRRNNPGVWTQLIEALELLELLARVDHKSAWQLLFNVAASARTLELYGDQLLPSGTTVMPRFVVNVGSEELLEETETTIQSCIRLIVVNEQTSSKYSHVKEAMLRQWRDQHNGLAFDRDLEGRVKLSLSFCASMEFENEEETGYVFSQIQNVAFAHSDLSLLERHDNGDQWEDDDEENGDGEDAEEEEEGERGEEGEVESGHDNGEDEESGDPDKGSALQREGGANENSGDPEDTLDELQNANAPPRGPFEIESFRFQLLEHPVSNMVLYMINEAGKSGMCMSHVTIATMWHERLHHSVIGGFLLNQLVPWRGRRDENLGIQNLTLDVGGFDAAAVRACCTAIAHSRSLRAFQFRANEITHENPIHVQGNVWWPWLAYALFSGDADHAIHEVSLNVQTLEVAHVAIMRQVLEHTDPLAFLFQWTSRSDEGSLSPPPHGPAMAATLSPTALLRLGHHRVIAEGQENDIPGVRVQEPGVTYQVVRNRPAEAYIEILLPGTGVCWTDSSELMELQPLARRERHPIRSLTIEDIDCASGPGVIDLLALIGEPIERLTVSAKRDDRIPTGVFHAIQASCANLKQLHVIFGFAPKIDWLSSIEWTLESLILTGASAAADDGWSHFLSRLSDPTTPLAQSVRHIHINVVPTTSPSDVNVDLLLAMIGDMLERNHRLVRFEVSGCGATEFRRHKNRIMAHHDEPICVEKAPLTRDAKLAFLSVTTPSKPKGLGNGKPKPKRAKHTTPDPTATIMARTKLDPHVLRTIMEMAALSERRVCGLAA